MSKMNRREFLEFAAQAAAISGAAVLPGGHNLFAESASGDEWEFYYPGVYDKHDKKVLDAFQARLALINSYGPIDLQDVIGGKLTNANAPAVSWNPYENNFHITRDGMVLHAHSYAHDNPLFFDDAYARNAGYAEAVAFPLLLTLECMPAMPKKEGIGDYMVVSSHNDTYTYLKPLHAGETLFTIYQEQHCVDITPAAGSHYRTFAMSGWAKTYNQNGELVAEGANILKESFRRHKNPAKRNVDGAHAWESPDWWHQRPAHQYTDKDWDTITAMWKAEKRRGAEPLYWDDVRIGDEPTPTAVGPIISDVETDMLFAIPAFCTDIRKNVLNPVTRSSMVRNQQGIYVMPEYLHKKPAPQPFSGAGKDTRLVSTPEIANRDGRATLQNAVCGKCATGMLTNWMGDRGWLERIGWDIMAKPPGYPESVIPSITKLMMPALFDKYPYMERVPSMREKRAICHPLEGDLIVSRAYVTDKYEKNGDYFVDLTWWSQTIDEKALVEEGFATVKLPKRS